MDSVVNMEGFGNNVSPQVQVIGVSDDGTELYVRFDESRWPAEGETVDIVASSQWSMTSTSYYQGGNSNNTCKICPYAFAFLGHVETLVFVSQFALCGNEGCAIFFI